MTLLVQRLPTELERIIFEEAATCHSSSILKLIRVARRVRVWIEPFLYRTLITDNTPRGLALQRTIYTKRPGFFREHTRQLYLTGAGKWCESYVRDLLLELLSKGGTGVSSLAVSGIWTTPQQKLLQNLAGVRRWSGFLYSLFGHEMIYDDLSTHFASCACFALVTHMDIFDTFGDEDASSLCTALSTLPKLTHLCFTDATPLVLKTVAEQCPELKVLVYMPSRINDARLMADHPPAPFATLEPRFAVNVLVSRRFWRDWEFNSDPHTSGFWAAAEAFVDRKRRGDKTASAYWMDYGWMTPRRDSGFWS
uniref:F-box domain-containing protein n=1 Tax=Mycena chlorophos TaxID=658473 RepID=A0ABQ0M172_MYCCL|nr:predicted protein [Mycena chlorophos]